MTLEEKRNAVFAAAADVFSRYGFRRTSMNDIAEAAGISRPALYLMFDNKEDLFRQLATHRQTEAIEAAAATLAQDGPVGERVACAILAYERIYYEPVAGSPHGAELMDLNQSVASDDMARGRDRLVAQLAASLEAARARGEVAFTGERMQPAEFAELLMASINGMKKAATSVEDFRRRIRAVAEIFMRSIMQRFGQ